MQTETTPAHSVSANTCFSIGRRADSGRDAPRANLDRRVSSFARLSESSGARVCSRAPERSEFFIPEVLPRRLGRVSLSRDGRFARRAGAAVSHRDGGARVPQPVRPRAARRGVVFSSPGATGCGGRVFVVAADRLQRFFSRRISEFRSEHCRGIFGAGIVAALACEAGNRTMGCGSRWHSRRCISRTCWVSPLQG